MTYLDVFRGASNRMAQESFAMKDAFKSSGGELGRNREDLLRRFLREHLPRRFGVGNGIILLGNQKVSTQQDVVVYDSLDHPVLLTDSPAALFTAESVQATIEVKSNLTREELSSAAKKSAELKRALRMVPRDLGRNPAILPNPLTCVFAFDGPSPSVLKANLIEVQKSIPLEDRLDLALVLPGTLARGGNFLQIALYGEAGSPYRASLTPAAKADLERKFSDGVSVWDSHENGLFLFFHYALSYIGKRPTGSPQFALYVPPSSEFAREV